MVFFDIDYTLFDTALYKQSGLQELKVYDEVPHVLEELSSLAILGIYSEGEKDFQKNKLAKTNLERFFNKNHTHIIAEKDIHSLEDLAEHEKEDLFLVDDKLSILHEAKKRIPSIITVWVKRGPYADAATPIEGFVPDNTVDDLHELVEIVKSSKN